MRLTRPSGETVRVDKASRGIRPGDALVFAISGRLVAVRIEGLGERRGSAGEARALYSESPH